MEPGFPAGFACGLFLSAAIFLAGVWGERRSRELETQRAQEHLAAVSASLEQANTERSYWRARAELLIDAGLVRTGATHEPVMRDPPKPPRSVAQQVVGALGITTIDSRQMHRQASKE